MKCILNGTEAKTYKNNGMYTNFQLFQRPRAMKNDILYKVKTDKKSIFPDVGACVP